MEDALALLNDLRGLQLPDPVSWWPPAAGWWILLLLTIILCAAVLHFRNRPRQVEAVSTSEFAFARLKQAQENFSSSGDWRQLSADLSALLRQVAMTVSTRQEVAALTGTAWLQWLDQTAGRPLFENSAARLLADMHYRRAAHTAADAEVLIGACREWISAVFEKKEEENGRA